MANQVYLILFVFLFGVFSTILLRRPFNFLRTKFRERAPIVKKYWKFVVPFSLLVLLAYLCVYFFAYSEINFGIVGQISGLALAIFAGYIAFSEFGEGKFDRLVEDGMSSLRRNEFNNAHSRLSEAHSIKPKEARILGNLLEIKLMLGKYDEFDSKIEQYKRISLEKTEELTYFYLLALRHLLKEHNSEARTFIEQSIEFVNEHLDIREKFYWTNDELVNSPAFQRLATSSKKQIINHYNYLRHQLSIAEEGLFVGGDYETNTSATSALLTVPASPINT